MSETEFVDTENFQSHVENISFRDIVLNHYKRISEFASVEMIGGYWQDEKISVGGQINVVKKYVADTRQCYINAVDHLSNMLLPHFDNDMQIAENNYLSKVERINNDKSISDKELPVYLYNVSKELFRNLSKFLFRTNYLAASSYEEVAL